MNYLDRIAGYEVEKRELREIVEILKNRQKYLDKGAALPKGLVISGDRGMGKKLFLEALSNECGMHVRKVDTVTALDGRDLFHRIRRAFIKGARSAEPSIIFIADIDKFFPDVPRELYDERSASLLTQLVDLLDGIERFGHVFFVITCKDLASLPPELVQTGRLDKSISLIFPTRLINDVIF